MLGPLGQMVAGTSETMQVHFVKLLETEYTQDENANLISFKDHLNSPKVIG